MPAEHSVMATKIARYFKKRLALKKGLSMQLAVLMV